MCLGTKPTADYSPGLIANALSTCHLPRDLQKPVHLLCPGAGVHTARMRQWHIKHEPDTSKQGSFFSHRTAAANTPQAKGQFPLLSRTRQSHQFFGGAPALQYNGWCKSCRQPGLGVPFLGQSGVLRLIVQIRTPRADMTPLSVVFDFMGSLQKRTAFAAHRAHPGFTWEGCGPRAGPLCRSQDKKPTCAQCKGAELRA